MDDAMHTSTDPYPPISDYALISDCHCVALVGLSGSIDWCCMPRMDADSCFGRLLGWKQGGYCRIAPDRDGYRVERRYHDDTLVLRTEFESETGRFAVTDFFIMSDDPEAHSQYCLMRIVEGLHGRSKVRIEVAPRFDYGSIIPHVAEWREGVYTAVGSNNGLLIQSDFPLNVEHARELQATHELSEGERISLAIRFEAPEALSTLAERVADKDHDASASLRTTERWWHDWIDRTPAPYRSDPQMLRSLLVIKGLTFERTGAVIAAATTSLPEAVGGDRNWDYRFSWIRDSVLAIRALHPLGFSREANRFRTFIERSAAGSAEQLQIMYGVDGNRRLTEIELEWLEGYRCSRPVRIGNRAYHQTQHDSFGELLELAWISHGRDQDIAPNYWDFICELADTVCKHWREPDHGIWEFRSGEYDFVHSKASCWVALDRAIRLAEHRDYAAPENWYRQAEAIRTAIDERGYDQERGIYIQGFDRNYLDASVLMLPLFGYLDYDDPRMLRTVDALCGGLERDGLLLRYDGPDGLSGEEGTFVPCTFWLVECLARQGQRGRAERYYARAMECANDLGLFSEEYDVDEQCLLGNFPQILTHVSQMLARMALEETR
jgi:GH15 family glucan-1,4-alpha-glucosidase